MGPRSTTTRTPKIATIAAPLHLSEADIDSTIWTADFQISPEGTLYQDGVNTIEFPAGSVCDPATSSYGVTEWDMPCAPIFEPLDMHVVLYTHNGERFVQFSPDVRFAPAADSSEMVMLTTTLSSMTTSTAPASAFNVLWSPDGVTGVDEAQTDSSLATQVFKSEGKLVRRIKHFSGYVVMGGRTCDPAQDPTCQP